MRVGLEGQAGTLQNMGDTGFFAHYPSNGAYAEFLLLKLCCLHLKSGHLPACEDPGHCHKSGVSAPTWELLLSRCSVIGF